MPGRIAVILITMAALSPLGVLAERASLREAPAIPLRNWIPALAAHPLTADEGAVAATALPSGASHFIAVTPCRVVDTRGSDGAHGGPILTGGVARAFEIPAGPCPGIPVAAAYSLNVTVTGSAAGASQFLTAYPAGTSRPLNATMVFNGGQTLSNAALVPADGSGSIEIYASATTHVILDINGYVKEGVVTSIAPGAGLTGGGTGDVGLSVAPGGVGATQLGASAVTTGAIEDAAVTGPKIANSQIVRDVNGVKDSVVIAGAGGAGVSTVGSTITVSAPAPPAGSVILGLPGDTTLIGAGYLEVADSGLQMWGATASSGAPTARHYHTAVWTGTKMIIWGGYGIFGEENTGAQYDPASDSWSATTTAGAPLARNWHSAVWTGTRMIVWGGIDGGPQDSGGMYDPTLDSWTATATFGAPSARFRQTAVWTGSVMIVWGGFSSDLENTGGRFDPSVGASGAWASTTTTNAPSARQLHTAAWTGSVMVVWGGSNISASTNTGGRYDPAADSWTATSTSGAPAARFFHTAVWSGTRMIVWGGINGGYTNTGGQYNPATNSWTATSPAGAPTPRGAHSAVWTGTRMIVWGGDGGARVDTGGRYDPSANSWTQTSTAAVPAGRQLHTAVWTGTKMIVWGGDNGSEYLNTGGHWTPLSYYQKT